MTTKQDIDLIIARYISGVATPQDLVSLSDWLEADLENGEILVRIRQYWDNDASTIINYGVDDFGVVLDKIGGIESRIIPQKRREPKRISSLLLSISAVVVVLMGIAALWFNYNPIEKSNYVITTGGSVSSFTLPDGTLVSLNKNSSLSYTDRYGGKDRVVSIDGEVWFDVSRDEKRRFVVEMGSSKIIVLGTSFVASYKRDEQLIKTSLVDGSLLFENGEQRVVLTPCSRLKYNNSTGEINIEIFDPEIETAWKDNIVRYKSMRFVDFVQLLEEKYEIPIHLSGTSLDSLRMSGSFGAQHSVEQVLDIIKYVIPYRWEHADDSYIIYPQNEYSDREKP